MKLTMTVVSMFMGFCQCWLQLELFLSSGTVCSSIYSLIAGIFGMNIPYSWNDEHGYMFKWVSLTPLSSDQL